MPTYYVRASGGNDSNTGLSFAQAWATLTKAVATIAAGDTVLVCSDGTHTYGSGISFNNAAGTVTQPLTIRGAGPTGADDGSIATISGGGTATYLINLGSTSWNYRFQNLNITNATYGVYHNSNTGSNYSFLNCRIYGNSTTNVRFDTLSSGCRVHMAGCELDTSGSLYGLRITLSPNTFLYLVNCSFHDNVRSGLIVQGNTRVHVVVEDCNFYDNGYQGIYVEGDITGAVIKNCVFFNNFYNGLRLNTTTTGNLLFMNNIMRLNGGYGINCNSTSTGQFGICDYNCYSGNTLGNININGGVPIGSNSITSNPLFVSEVDGSEDFRLQYGSPCSDIGYGYNG